MLQSLPQAQGGQIRHMQITLTRLNDLAQRIGPRIPKLRSIGRAPTAQRIQNDQESPSHVLTPLLA